jgi:hypothetical protein
LPFKTNSNTSRSTDIQLLQNNLNLGNQTEVPINITANSFNQSYYVNYFQFTPPFTNNASVTGKIFVDRNQDNLFQTNGIDGLSSTPEDNEIVLRNIPINLTGTSLQGQTVNRSVNTGADGRYQITDLPAGSYQIQAGTP